MKCSVEGCTNAVHCKSMCQNHYRKQRKWGRPEGPTDEQRKKPGPKADPSKPYSKHKPKKGRHRPTPKTECPVGHPYDEQNTYVDSKGYRHCRECRAERMRDARPKGAGQGGHNRKKTHCPQGHAYDEENTLWRGNRRACRACALVNSARQNVKRYGLDPEQFMSMLVRQNNACMICQVPFGAKAPHIDHDHACCSGGKSCGQCVRGLLCADCNKGLGLFKDDPERLRSAIEYLSASA